MALPWRDLSFQLAQNRFPSQPGKKPIRGARKIKPSPLSASKEGMKKKILIIEDQYGFREIFTDVLNHGGYHVTQADSGEVGWELLKGTKPDLILLDLMLPKIHGFDLLKKIRYDPATKDIPVIIISVLEETAEKAKALELGANDYLVKGHLSFKQILEKVSAFFQP